MITYKHPMGFVPSLVRGGEPGALSGDRDRNSVARSCMLDNQ